MWWFIIDNIVWLMWWFIIDNIVWLMWWFIIDYTRIAVGESLLAKTGTVFMTRTFAQGKHVLICNCSLAPYTCISSRLLVLFGETVSPISTTGIEN
jgi:hypothetical protein